MYSNHYNVNVLTSLLVAHEIKHAVVCPGSRNAPIVNNLYECPQITCHPVTDERSAGFQALGIAQATGQPVVVCVTSGSALLNVAPAVAEAALQHQSLVVVTADRPQQWIGQLDGQTLTQPGVFGSLVAADVTLPEPHDDEERWYCKRLINEALLETHRLHRPCVHINVPISEPLFDFSVSSLPTERSIRRFDSRGEQPWLPLMLTEGLAEARRPIVVVGQLAPYDCRQSDLKALAELVPVLHESLSPNDAACHFDEVLYARSDMELPDFIVYVGGHIVSKRLKKFLRKSTEAEVWRINATGAVEDTFCNLANIVEGPVGKIIHTLTGQLQMSGTACNAYRQQWDELLARAREHAMTYEPAYSQLAAVRCLERLGQMLPHVHYANSTSVRLANIYANHHVWCNRGVNGIEGSFSTMTGFARTSSEPVYLVTGDLSFFYDLNAALCESLPSGLRILLLNNHEGGIFNMLKGLQQSRAHKKYIAGKHHNSASSLVTFSNFHHIEANDMDTLEQGIEELIAGSRYSSNLLEVTTDADCDAEVLRDYYQSLKL